MRTFLLFFALFTALPSQAGRIEDVLEEQQIDATAETFIPGVTWIDNPEQAYYQCSDRQRSDVVAELWQGEKTQIITRGAAPVDLLYGEHGEIKVFSIQDKAGGPALAAYLLLPTGETHLFRVNKELTVVKNSMEWRCKPAPYRAPPPR